MAWQSIRDSQAVRLTGKANRRLEEAPEKPNRGSIANRRALSALRKRAANAQSGTRVSERAWERSENAPGNALFRETVAGNALLKEK